MHFRFWITFLLTFYTFSLAAQHLEIAVYDAPPFGFRTADSSYAGLMIEIWEDIADDLEFSFTYHLTDMEGLLSGLEQQRYDIGLGAISITPAREKRVDFSQAVNPSGTGIAVSVNSRGNAFQVYWKPIFISLIQLIGSLLFVLLLSGTIVWLVERQHNAPPSDRSIKGLADGLWWSAVTMTTVGYGDKVPASQTGKVLGIIWIFTSIILLSLFTANASAIFNSARMESHVRTVEDLHGIKVGAQINSSGAEFLKREHVDHQSFDNLEEALDLLIDGQLDAVVSNVPVLKYYNHSTSYSGKLAISPEYLLKNNMGIAVQDQSAYLEAIDQVLLQKIAEPRWQRAVYKYLGE